MVSGCLTNFGIAGTHIADNSLEIDFTVVQIGQIIAKQSKAILRLYVLLPWV